MRARPAGTAPAPSRPWRRAGLGTAGVGLLLGVIGVAMVARIGDDGAGLGVMLVVTTLWLAGLLLLGTGLLRLRSGSDGAGDRAMTGWVWACALVDHRFVRVPAGADVAEHWRCRRCGTRRYTRPRSAGETLNATRVDLMWIDRGDAPREP